MTRTFFGPNRHKYNARKTEVDGIVFPSVLNARLYVALKEMGAEIIEREPRFLLQEKFVCRGKKYQEIGYKADFRVRYEGDEYIIEGKGMITPDFTLRLKMFMKRYGHENNLIICKSVKDLREQLTAEVMKKV